MPSDNVNQDDKAAKDVATSPEDGFREENNRPTEQGTANGSDRAGDRGIDNASNASETLRSDLWLPSRTTSELANANRARESATTSATVETTSLTLVDTGKPLSNSDAKVAVSSEAATAAKSADVPRKLTDKATLQPIDIFEPRKEANEALLKAAEETVNKSIWKLPSYVRGLPNPSPDLGCVSSFSDRFRRALQIEGRIDKTSDQAHRKYYQVNMDDLKRVMGSDQLLVRIKPEDAREGDVVMGLNPGTTSRHMGIVGKMENGQRMAYDNFGGSWRKEGLDARFGRYKEQQYYRAYLPEKKPK